MKKQNEASVPSETATVADDYGDAKDRLFHEIVPNDPLMSSPDPHQPQPPDPRSLPLSDMNTRLAIETAEVVSN